MVVEKSGEAAKYEVLQILLWKWEKKHASSSFSTDLKFLGVSNDTEIKFETNDLIYRRGIAKMIKYIISHVLYKKMYHKNIKMYIWSKYPLNQRNENDRPINGLLQYL